MQYEYRGRNLNDVLRRSISQVQCKSGNRSHCDRISRLRANHANNIAVILGEISDTVEEINRRAEALGKDFKIAAQNTGLDVLLLTFAGGQLIRLARAAARIDFQIQAGLSSVGSLKLLLNEMEDYQNRLRAYRDWREISTYRNRISSQRADLYRSIRILSELNDEAERLGCGRRDNYDPRIG